MQSTMTFRLPKMDSITAASGVAGVSELTGPTYFPRFNVLAGEAGREMMTVLARPRTLSIGGANAIIGSVGLEPPRPHERRRSAEP